VNRKITIAGGGLAGLALGIALRQNDVLVDVFEAGSYPRHRVCGEFLSGVHDETLEMLELTEWIQESPEIKDAAWYRDGLCKMRHELPWPARGVSRHRLDLKLANRFRERGGVLVENERLLPDAWANPGTVVTTGRQPVSGGTLIGLKVHLFDLPLEAGLEMHCSPDGYIGLCAVDDGRVNASALFRVRPGLKAPRAELQRAYLQACGMHRLVERMDAGRPDPESFAAVSGLSPGQFFPHHDPSLCAAGDRFGMIGPFTGNGMSMALESARLIREPLTAYAQGKMEWEEAIRDAKRRQTRQFGKRLALSAALHRALLSSSALSVMSGLAQARCVPMNFLFRQLR
jgi:2-polyprenyl-6-methoxyphenol hydroxylase-like FAD-dependent oxidoreductase